MSNKTKIAIGDTFNQLTIIKELPKKGFMRSCECKCTCGNTTTVSLVNLKLGRTKSCGCLRNKNLKARETHGMSKTVEYKLWARNKSKMCEEWKSDFTAFKVWYDKTFKLAGYYLIRKDLNKPLNSSNARLTPFRESVYSKLVLKHGVLIRRNTGKSVTPTKDLHYDKRVNKEECFKFTAFVKRVDRFHTWSSSTYSNSLDNMKRAYDSFGYMKEYITENFDWELLKPRNFEKLIGLA
jgi:hypothetical protein